MKAKLRDGESMTISGYAGEVTSDMLFDFEYDLEDTFFIIINNVAHEEVSTAFDFINE